MHAHTELGHWVRHAGNARIYKFPYAAGVFGKVSMWRGIDYWIWLRTYVNTRMPRCEGGISFEVMQQIVNPA
jgi:hypothetical protein